MSDALLKLSGATAALAEARTLDDVKKIANIAEAARTYARAAKLGLEAQNHAAELKLRAERKAGEMLAQLERAPEGRPEKLDQTGTVSEYKTVLDESQISNGAAHRWQIEASLPEPMFEKHIAEVRASGGELTQAGVLKAATGFRKDEARAATVALGQDIQRSGHQHRVFQSSVWGAIGMMRPNSVDAIITDPPYPKEYISVYIDLAKAAAVTLKPGGSLFVMSGQSWLPDVIRHLSAELTYNWTLAYLTPGGGAVRVMQRTAITFWKPVLWYVKGELGKTEWLGDVCRSDAGDKRFHDWGQSVSGMVDLVTRTTKEGDLIWDPFCGGGSTGVAAALTNRRFIGSDSDADQVSATIARLEEVRINRKDNAE